ncbi:MAG TPA: hypothetical protein EYM63_00770 [Acidobacteria bacterium]|nr:hypothetical protein [Acidobacteriota bacterium]
MRAKSFWSTALLLVMTTLVASAATIGRPATQQEPEPWVHVEVTSDGGTNMNLDLPLAAVTAMLALAPETIVQNGEFQFGSSYQVPVAAIREMWRELRDVGDVEFVTIQYEGQDVRIARAGEIILVNVSDSDGDDESVRVEIPVPVVDALLSGDGDTLNIGAAIEELSMLRGELVRVIESDNNIRIWIDESPTR